MLSLQIGIIKQGHVGSAPYKVWYKFCQMFPCYPSMQFYLTPHEWVSRKYSTLIWSNSVESHCVTKIVWGSKDMIRKIKSVISSQINFLKTNQFVENRDTWCKTKINLDKTNVSLIKQKRFCYKNVFPCKNFNVQQRLQSPRENTNNLNKTTVTFRWQSISFNWHKMFSFCACSCSAKKFCSLLNGFVLHKMSL